MRDGRRSCYLPIQIAVLVSKCRHVECKETTLPHIKWNEPPLQKAEVAEHGNHHDGEVRRLTVVMGSH